MPRYGIESLSTTTTAKTDASDNVPAYIQAALQAGIAHPIGMCLQDAGWNHGPRLGSSAYNPTEYVTWQGYFETCAIQTPKETWHFSQEDVLVSLVWGSQILQNIAKEVRSTENQILISEKLASIAAAYRGQPWPKESLDEAWRTLLLAEHHDCWITPYNLSRSGDRLTGSPRGFTQTGTNTWAGKIAIWTENTRKTGQAVIQQSLAGLSPQSRSGQPCVRVFNTLGVDRDDLASAVLPQGWRLEASGFWTPRAGKPQRKSSGSLNPTPAV